MKPDRSLCSANVSLPDLIKGWFVALTKQLRAYPSRTLRLFLLACEACGARQLAWWAEPYRSLPGLVVVEPAE
jgi:hypothetical protein